MISHGVSQLFRKKVDFQNLSYCECLEPEIMPQDQSFKLIEKFSLALSFYGVLKY